MNVTIPIPALGGRRLLSGQYLASNDYIVSENLSFFAIMQDDGNFCTYQGTGPTDNRGLIWCSGKVAERGNYVAAMQYDGNFAIYRGTNLSNIHGLLWHAVVTRAGQYFQLKIQSDGNLVLADSYNADVTSSVYWANGQIAVAVPPFVVDQQAIFYRSNTGGRPVWQSFVSSRSGLLISVDLALAIHNSTARTQDAVVSIYEGVGTSGLLLRREPITLNQPDSKKGLQIRNYPFAVPPFLTQGAAYSIYVCLKDEPMQGPLVQLCSSRDYPAGQCSYIDNTLTFRTYMRTPQPSWSHPVG